MQTLSDFAKYTIKKCSPLIPGACYGTVLGIMNKNGEWNIAPYGNKGYDGLYPLDEIVYIGRYIGHDDCSLVEKFSQNGTEVHKKINTYSFIHNPTSNYISWTNDIKEYIQINGTQCGNIYPYIIAQTCFVEIEPPKNEKNIVIRGPLLVGHSYETVIGRPEGTWPHTIYYANSPPTYLGKYKDYIIMGAGDGAMPIYLFERSDGSIVRHELNYVGTTCFRECEFI